jgi:L-threonylcarbamoyladenylate synthase
MSVPRVRDDAAGRLRAIAVLRSGGLVAIPTDTVYGIAVALDTPRGIERLFAAKARPAEKAIMVLVDSLEQVQGLVRVPRSAGVLGAIGWPGGLTLVLPLLPEAVLPAALTAGLATLGVRVPDHPAARTLAAALGPLPTTSANRSGDAEARDADAVEAALGGTVTLILDGGPSPGGTPSTVIDCSSGPPRLLRSGAIAPAVLAAALEAAGEPHRLGSS